MLTSSFFHLQLFIFCKFTLITSPSFFFLLRLSSRRCCGSGDPIRSLFKSS